ncbi:hypothetical protein KAR91_37620 [Candidatus Pacearchaeota archaeon]|nr:hypothetical protein [Candidatus Pacearchaeota archaeon]
MSSIEELKKFALDLDPTIKKSKEDGSEPWHPTEEEKKTKKKPKKKKIAMRTFKLDRHQDLSGNSGTGIVAEGAEFSDGTVALRWLTDSPTSTLYNSMDDVMKLHHHDGATEVVFDDEEDSGKEGAMNPVRDLKKLANGLNKQSQGSSAISEEVSKLLQAIEDLVAIRGNIEQAIHQSYGSDSPMSQAYYDADTHLDEASRAFKMLRDTILDL